MKKLDSRAHSLRRWSVCGHRESGIYATPRTKPSLFFNLTSGDAAQVLQTQSQAGPRHVLLCSTSASFFVLFSALWSYSLEDTSQLVFVCLFVLLFLTIKLFTTFLYSLLQPSFFPSDTAVLVKPILWDLCFSLVFRPLSCVLSPLPFGRLSLSPLVSLLMAGTEQSTWEQQMLCSGSHRGISADSGSGLVPGKPTVPWQSGLGLLMWAGDTEAVDLSVNLLCDLE